MLRFLFRRIFVHAQAVDYKAIYNETQVIEDDDYDDDFLHDGISFEYEGHP